MAALFQVNCPKCGAPLLPENVNVAGDVFLCRAWFPHGKISELMQTEEEEGISEVVPSGVSVAKDMHGVVLRFGKMKKEGFFLLLFSLVWNTMISAFLYVMASGKPYTLNGVEKTGLDEAALLFTVPFVVVGAAVLFGAVFLLFGTAKLALRPGRGELFRGVWGMGRRQGFRLAKGARISLEDGTGGKVLVSVEQPSGRPFVFGMTTVDREAGKYLAAVLRQWRE